MLKRKFKTIIGSLGVLHFTKAIMFFGFVMLCCIQSKAQKKGNETLINPNAISSKNIASKSNAVLLKQKGNTPYLVKGRPIGDPSRSKTTFKIQRGATPSNKATNATEKATTPDENGRYCTTSVVSEEKGDYTKIVTGNQNDKIYPGAIYFDEAFITGTYNAPDALQLQPYDITTDLFSAAYSGSSIERVEPSLGGVNDGISNILRKSGTVRNASRIAVEVKAMNSLDQLAFEIGANFTGFNVDLNVSFNYMKSTNKNVFIAKLTQVYFSVMLNRAEGRLLATNNPLSANLVYINKVNYGRMGYILISSDSSRESIQAALDFTYSSGSVSGGLNGRLNSERVLNTMQVSGFFFGGDAANSFSINTPNQLQAFDEYVRSGLRLDPNVAPTAISYELKYLNDNATAATRSTTTYTERQCTPAKGLKIQMHNVAIEDSHSGDCSYAWGKVEVEVWETDATRNPISLIWKQEMWSATGSAPNRTVINYKDIRENATIRNEIRDIPNGVRYLTLNPTLVNENRIMIRFKMNINTNHKDNDFAILGFHGMNREEIVDRMLNEVFVGNEAIQANPNRYKYGTFTAGKFCSNSDRVHCFYALFTITNN